MDGSGFPTGLSLNLRQIPKFCEDFPTFDETAVTALVKDSEKNGLDEYGAIIRLNRRTSLIDVDRFFAWLETLRGQAA